MKHAYWLKSGFYTLLDRFSMMIFGFGGLLLLTRLLSEKEFGTWALFATITSFVEVGRIGLLQNALTRYLRTTPTEDHADIQTSSVMLNFGLSITSALLLLVLSVPLSKVWGISELFPLFCLYALTTFLLTPLYQFNFIQQANLDFKGIFLSNVIRQGSFFAYILYLFTQHRPFSLFELAVVQLMAAIPATLLAFYFVRKYLHFSRTFHKEWFLKLFNFGKFNLGTNLSTMSYKSVDKWLLEGLLKLPELVGHYELAVRITNLVEVPTVSLAFILFPQSAQRMAEQGVSAVKDLYEKSVGVILAMVIPFILFIWIGAPYIVPLIGSEKFVETIPLLRITVLYGLFIPYAIQFGTVLDSMGKPKVNFYFTLLSAIVNLLCNYIFISWLGVKGAAFGTLTSFMIMFCVMQTYLYHKINTNPLIAFRFILPFYRDMMGYLLSFFSKRWKQKMIESNI